MTQRPQLAIIGCGWLGRHILPSLLPIYEVLATTAHAHTAEQLNVPAVVYDWQKDVLPQALLTADYTLIAIPPTAGGYAQYAQHMARLAKTLDPTKHVMMISSTGVYAKAAGLYDEMSEVSEDNAILQAEQALTNVITEANILRCSGLFGDGRLSGEQYYGQSHDMANKRLNLVHYKDIARAIIAVFNHDMRGAIYNLAHPEHPLRHDYYAAQAQLRQQPTPRFNNSHTLEDRIIDGTKITSELDFAYQCPPTQTL